MTNQIVTTNGNGKSLTAFGERDDIREMADRIVKMMPGTVRLNPTEALTVAQIAVAHGLDPFNGEVWGLKGENDKWYGTMVGIKGLRKCARRQADSEGGTYWTEPPKRVEPKTYGAPDTAIVYEIHLRDTVTMQAYGKSLHTLIQAGMPYAEAVRMIGAAPVWVGVGVATTDERSKMSIHARAKKRAEADALKQRYDVQLIGVQYTEASEDLPEDAPQMTEATDAEYIPVENERRSEDQILMELGYN